MGHRLIGEPESPVGQVHDLPKPLALSIVMPNWGIWQVMNLPHGIAVGD